MTTIRIGTGRGTTGRGTADHPATGRRTARRANRAQQARALSDELSSRRSTEMFTMHEALAREHARQLHHQARRHTLARELAAANRWHVLARRAHTVSRRHANRADRMAQALGAAN